MKTVTTYVSTRTYNCQYESTYICYNILYTARGECCGRCNLYKCTHCTSIRTNNTYVYKHNKHTAPIFIMQYNYTITCMYAYNTMLKYCITIEEYVCTYVRTYAQYSVWFTCVCVLMLIKLQTTNKGMLDIN